MGGSDCELISAGWLAQPANALSSVAYLVAAAWVLGRRGRGAARAAPRTVAGALALALVSAGSIAYHGPQPSWSETAHDTSITLLLVALVAHQLDGRRRGDVRPVHVAAAGAVVAGAVVVTASSGPLLVHGALGISLVGAVARRRRRSPGGRERWPAAALAALGLGVALYLSGRTGAPLCRPTALLQAHAGWHVLTAVAAAALLARAPASERRPGVPA